MIHESLQVVVKVILLLFAFYSPIDYLIRLFVVVCLFKFAINLNINFCIRSRIAKVITIVTTDTTHTIFLNRPSFFGLYNYAIPLQGSFLQVGNSLIILGPGGLFERSYVLAHHTSDYLIYTADIQNDVQISTPFYITYMRLGCLWLIKHQIST